MPIKPATTASNVFAPSSLSPEQLSELGRFAAPNAANNAAYKEAKAVEGLLERFSPFHRHQLVAIAGNGSAVMEEEDFLARYTPAPAQEFPLYWHYAVMSEPGNPTNGINISSALKVLSSYGVVDGVGALIRDIGADGTEPIRYFLALPQIRQAVDDHISKLGLPIQEAIQSQQSRQ